MKQRASKADIDSFLAERVLAVAGVSRSGKKFGNAVFKEMKQKGYTVYPLNPNAKEIEGEPCYPNIESLPKNTGGLLLVVKPEQALSLVTAAHAAGIGKVWFQQGSESEDALEFCRKRGMTAVSDECVLMHGDAVGSIHKVHRFFRRLFGTMPA